MTGKTHDAFAFAFLITAASFYPPENMTVLTVFSCVIAADIGALIPDIDQAGARLWDMLPGGGSAGKILSRFFYKHRTLTHSLLGLLLIYKLLEWLLPRFLNPAFVDPYLILTSVMIGYISHLVADGITEEGLPLFFPLNLNIGFPPFRSMRLKTGRWFEKFVVYPGIWIYVIWFINLRRDIFLGIINAIK